MWWTPMLGCPREIVVLDECKSVEVGVPVSVSIVSVQVHAIVMVGEQGTGEQSSDGTAEAEALTRDLLAWKWKRKQLK